MLLALVAAQVAAPFWNGFHTWECATGIAIAMGIMARCGLTGEAWADSVFGTRPVLTVIGALLIGAAALANGLLGPDRQTIRRVPGVVAVIPDVAAAAFFPPAGAAAIARGDAAITLRRRTGTSLELASGSRMYYGGNLLAAVPLPVAYVDVRDSAGVNLTLTQPTNPSFLSPLALFAQTVTIAGRGVPADAFAVPARHRTLRVFYFASGTLPGSQTDRRVRGPVILLAVDDESGNPLPGGIGAAVSGQTVSIGGLKVQATPGLYPALTISSIPSPAALWLGLLALLGGLIGSGRRAPVSPA